MYEDEDMETLKKVKSYRSKKKKSFSSTINSKFLTDEDMDDLFLSS